MSVKSEVRRLARDWSRLVEVRLTPRQLFELAAEGGACVRSRDRGEMDDADFKKAVRITVENWDSDHRLTTTEFSVGPRGVSVADPSSDLADDIVEALARSGG